MIDILKEYFNYVLELIVKILTMDTKYLLTIAILFLLFHIVVSYTIDIIYKNMNRETSPLLLIPFINIYYIGKQIHSLYGTIMIVETLLLLSYPYKTHGIWTISRLCSNKISNLLLVALILEVPISIGIILYQYLKYENRIRIVK